MKEFIEIHWTSGSIEEARKICRFLVQERLAASANIIPWMESIVMLNNQLETQQESQVIIKTRRSRFEEIKELIQENSSYEIPEITLASIEDGSAEYLNWLETSTAESPT
jgi:periplasmic divalent cation tolerance protein